MMGWMNLMDCLILMIGSGSVDWIMVNGSVVGWLVVDGSVIDGLVVDSLVVDRLVIEMLRMQLSDTRFLWEFWFKATFSSIPVDFFVMRHNWLLTIFAVQSSLVDVFLRFLLLLSLLIRFASILIAANRRLSRFQSLTDFWQLVLYVLDTVVRWWMVHDWSFVSLHWITLNMPNFVRLGSLMLLLVQV